MDWKRYKALSIRCSRECTCRFRRRLQKLRALFQRSWWLRLRKLDRGRTGFAGHRKSESAIGKSSKKIDTHSFRAVFIYLIIITDSKPAPLPRASSVLPEPHRNEAKDSSNGSQNRSAHITAQALEHLLAEHWENGAENAAKKCEWSVC
jgi:hypothetical protein